MDFFKVLSAERERLGLSVKVFMKALRYALAGEGGIFLCLLFVLLCLFSIRIDLVWQLL